MRLLFGPPGSGKTSQILSELRAEARRRDVRLVVPVATMAEHLRNRLAREALPVAPSCVVTLAGLLHELAPEWKVADSAQLSVLVELALAAEQPAAYRELAGSPGLAPALAAVIGELSNAGCDALQWQALGGMGLQTDRALGVIYEAVEQRLKQAGTVLRAEQVASAARGVAEGRTIPRRIWFDGFFTFSRVELQLILALSRKCDLTVALPEWKGAVEAREFLRQAGFRENRLQRVRPAPRLSLVAAPTREREAEEAALRLLEERVKGRAWHEMGIVIRGPEPYWRLLRTTLDRLGIPCRWYFAEPLSRHPVGRFLASLVEAALSGWTGEQALAALRSAVSVSGRGQAADEWEYRVRKALPLTGLAGLREVLGSALPDWERWESWTAAALAPQEWVARLGTLTEGVAGPEGDGPFTPEEIRAWRSRAAAIRAWHDCLAGAAAVLDQEPILLEAFWRHAAAAMSQASVRVTETRRDAVSILDAVEARQWELPVVIVCGLLEGEFPSAPTANALLSEELRIQLRQRGVMVRSRAEREAEEAFLLEMAQTRATSELILSWPQQDDEGRPTLRAFALDHLDAGPVAARAVKVEPWAAAARPPRPALGDAAILDALAQRHARYRPTELEQFLQCPFRYHAERHLGLEEPPALPAGRLDGRALGTLAHEVIAEWHRGQAGMEEILERRWAAMIRKERIPASHRVEVARLTMLRSLRFYESNNRLRDGWTTAVEVPLQLEAAGVPVHGRADRVDESAAGECIVYDFKYSGGGSVKKKLKKLDEGVLVQGGLYLAALEQTGKQAAGFYFTGVRGEPSWAGSEKADEVRQWMDQSLESAARAIKEISQGEIGVKPADEDGCRYCAFLDSCRIQEETWLSNEMESASS
ncbi:MAG: PD-(D/E)XK nuclease family protein [Acidobacteria bacterium]|nr:PD-(D/E)XK nuclease family protein [Acidobacteriota bacterium]